MKYKNIKAVIFDLDGTLLNTLQDLADAVNFALSENEMPTRSIDEVRRFVGNGVENLMIRAIPNGKDNTRFKKAFSDFKSYYAIHCKDHTDAYPGVLELMDQLKQKGILMAIVSNKLDSAVKELDKQFFSNYTGAAIGEMAGVARKPAPDTVEKALKELGISKDEAIYVGDSDVDVETARNAHMPCVSVLWGFRDKEFLLMHGADTFIESPEDLLELI